MKSVLYALILLFLLIGTSPLYAAKTSISISNSGEGSKSSVSVKNTLKSNTYNDVSTSDTETNIRIEANGEVKEYHSKVGGSVQLESSDGTATVLIHEERSKSDSSPLESLPAEQKQLQTNVTPTTIPVQPAKGEPTLSDEITEIEAALERVRLERKTILDALKDIFSRLLSSNASFASRLTSR